LANEEKEISRWGEILKRDCEAQLEELRFVAPWLALPAASQLEEKFIQLDRARTLREISVWDRLPDPLLDGSDEFAQFARCLREAGDHARERLTALEALAK